jgi:hypothetical protein
MFNKTDTVTCRLRELGRSDPGPTSCSFLWTRPSAASPPVGKPSPLPEASVVGRAGGSIRFRKELYRSSFADRRGGTRMAGSADGWPSDSACRILMGRVTDTDLAASQFALVTPSLLDLNHSALAE